MSHYWLLEALRGELQRAGYFLKVTDYEAKYQISLGMIDITDHKMSLEITVKEKEELIFIKSYSSKKANFASLQDLFWNAASCKQSFK